MLHAGNFSVLVAVSVLVAIWEPLPEPAVTAPKVRGKGKSMSTQQPEPLDLAAPIETVG